MAIAMLDSLVLLSVLRSGLLSNPIVAFSLRAALGAYVIFMARGFYADPFGYFRKWMPRMPEYFWARSAIRAMSAFCVWGGCFIVDSAIAAQLFHLHGLGLAALLMLLAVIATYFLLPSESSRSTPDSSSAREERLPPGK